MNIYEEHPKNVLVVTKAISDVVADYPPNVLKYKEKREKEIVKASEAYSEGYEVLSWIKSIDTSYLLGCNEVVVRPFVQECGSLLGSIEFYLNEADRVSKGCNEVMKYYKDIRATFNKNKIISAMLSDIIFWAESFGFEIDKNSILKDFEMYRNDHIKKLAESCKA